MGGPACNEARRNGWRPPTRGEKIREEIANRMDESGPRQDMDTEEEEKVKPKRIRLREEIMETEEEIEKEPKGDNKEKDKMTMATKGKVGKISKKGKKSCDGTEDPDISRGTDRNV